MSFRLVVRPEVDADLLEAEIWYERQRPGLGAEFLRAVRKAMAILPDNPFLYPVRNRRLQVRWCYPWPFPYRIVYRVIQDTVVIYTVLHAARHEHHWQKQV
ncbi:MAG: type II toxin-antitoxin system RelE/ParE family toxin [Verrucomicrobiota bacterium]